MNYSKMEETILFEQFKDLLINFSHEIVVDYVASDVYMFTHRPTNVSFYVTEESEDGYQILYFYQKKTYDIGNIPSNDDLYHAINTKIVMENLSTILDAEFKLGDYLEKQKNPA